MTEQFIEFFQHLVNGLGLGAIYALLALGYTMVFGILKFINFAHSDIYMLGAFTGYYLSNLLGLTRFNQGFTGIMTLMFTMLISMCVCALIGVTMERLAYRPLRKSPKINVLITAIGMSLFFEYSGQLIFGADPKFFPELLEVGGPLTILGLNINIIQVLVLAISIGLMLVLRYVIFHTTPGLAMRAVSFNAENARLMGINVDRTISFTFIIGSALAGAAGVLVGMTYPKIDPLMGVMVGLKAFTGAVVGGIGNVTGAVLGGLIMGVMESLLVGYLSSTYRDALAFGILIIILLVRPTGLLGKINIEKV